MSRFCKIRVGRVNQSNYEMGKRAGLERRALPGIQWDTAPRRLAVAGAPVAVKLTDCAKCLTSGAGKAGERNHCGHGTFASERGLNLGDLHRGVVDVASIAKQAFQGTLRINKLAASRITEAARCSWAQSPDANLASTTS